MNPERWQKLKTLYEAALDKSAEERVAFLDQTCKTDPSLRKAVEELLESGSMEGFLEKTVYISAL